LSTSFKWIIKSFCLRLLWSFFVIQSGFAPSGSWDVECNNCQWNLEPFVEEILRRLAKHVTTLGSTYFQMCQSKLNCYSGFVLTVSLQNHVHLSDNSTSRCWGICFWVHHLQPYTPSDKYLNMYTFIFYKLLVIDTFP
jgi:hypothetical protein